MFRWIGIVCIVAGCSSLGFHFGNRVTERYRNSEYIRKALICLRGEIAYGRTPLPEALCTVARHTSGVVAVFFEMVSKSLLMGDGKMFSVCWQESLECVMKEKNVQKEDILYLHELGQTLGYLDVEMQINTLTMYLERMENSLVRQGKERRDKVRLCNILGVMGGVFITIILL